MERWEVICSLAPERLNEMEATQEQVTGFYADIECLNEYISSMDKTLQGLQLGEKIEEMLAEIVDDVQEHAKVRQQIVEFAEQLVEASGDTSAVALLKVQMLTLSNAWAAVEERLGELQDQIRQRKVNCVAVSWM